MTMNNQTTTEENRDDEGSETTGGQNRSASVPRIPVMDGIEIDLIREQLENHGRVVITREKGIFVPDRTVSLLTRALRVPRVPRSNGPTHFSIPRHVDRSGLLLASTADWDPINWRTRGARPQGARAILLSKPALRYMPESGVISWAQIEETLRGNGVNGVYEPLAVAIMPQGDAKAIRPELYSIHATGGSRKKSLVDMATSVFKRGSTAAADSSKESLTVSEAAKGRWAETLKSFKLNRPYIVVSPFGNPADGMHDWAVERCAEVLRHALEWRGVESIIVCTPENKGKAERLRIISGQNVAHIALGLEGEDLHAALAEARAVLATPGQLILAAQHLGTGTVCLAGPSTGAEGNLPHLVIHATGPEAKQAAEALGVEEHGCLEGLDAGPVARALSKVVVNH